MDDIDDLDGDQGLRSSRTRGAGIGNNASSSNQTVMSPCSFVRAAISDPVLRRIMLVRVWVFSTVFVSLDPALQQHVIERTEHSL